MALSNAERQRRWRARRTELLQTNPETIEAELLRDVRCWERGELSVRARAALADRLTAAAFGHWRAAAAFGHWRAAAAFERLAHKVRGD